MTALKTRVDRAVHLAELNAWAWQEDYPELVGTRGTVLIAAGEVAWADWGDGASEAGIQRACEAAGLA